MLKVILIMLFGMAVGYLIRSRKKLLKFSNTSILWVIILLLFVMGVSIGSNKEIMNSLDTIGIRGLQLAVVAVLGSSMLSWVVYKFILKPKNEHHER